MSTINVILHVCLFKKKHFDNLLFVKKSDYSMSDPVRGSCALQKVFFFFCAPVLRLFRSHRTCAAENKSYAWKN